MDVPIFIDAVHDDVNYASHMSRATFEELCHDLLERSIAPINSALKAANMTLADIHGVELIGGGMRVPKVQEKIQRALGDGLELGMHINSDESMALGAAFHGANVSTAFKVRHVGMTDINPFPVSVSLGNLESEEKGRLFGKGKKKTGEEEEWSKEATVFKANGKIGIKKTIAFTHDHDVDCTIKYEADEFLPQGTNEIIEKYNITGVETFAKEMEEKGLGKPKLSLQFELSTSGIIKLSKAEAAVEETYTVTEEVEVDDEESSTDGSKEDKEKSGATPEEKSDETAPDETSAETNKEEPKKKKTISVEKEKKRVHKRALTINSYHVGSVQPYNEVIMAESKAKLDELARMDKERMMFEEVRNNYEAYIYTIKNKLVDMEDEINAVTSEEQRASVANSAEAAENWMYDEGYDADFETYKAKYEALKAPFEKILFRVKEVTARTDAIADLSKKLEKLESLMVKWETTMPQVTEEERAEVIAGIAKVREWIADKVAAQEAADPTADPVFTSDEVPLQTVSLQATVSRLSKKPKPAAPKKEDKKPEGESGGDSKSETNEEAEKGQNDSTTASESDSTKADDSQSDASEEL
jgi:hypoxia up-regulated 1